MPLDMQGFIDQAIASGQHNIVVPPGRYRVTPRNGVHLALKNLHDIQIIADGVEMVCTQTTLAIATDRCHNLTLRGLTIDYDPLPFTEGRITAVAPDHSWLEFAVADGYPDQKLVARVEIYDSLTHLLKTPTYFGWQAFVALGNHRYRIGRQADYRYNSETDIEAVGDILVTNNSFAPDGESAHAVLTTNCSNVRFENVTLYASNCFGFLEDSCDSTVYQRCRIDRCPPERDLVPRALPRLRSLDADAFHSANAFRGPAIVQCTAKFQGDDCVNIHGEYYFVTTTDGPTLRVLATNEIKIAPGDPVELLTYQGIRPPDARAVSLATDGQITAAERAFIIRQPMDAGIRTRGLTHAYRLTLDRAVVLPEGSLVCSGNRVGNGFRVEGCDFGFNRSRGILIKASDGTVIDNHITGSWLSGILVTPEFWWLEAASSNHLTIRGNMIADCRDVAINVTAAGGTGKLAPAGAHMNITIANNTIRGSPLPNIVITSTDGLSLSGNTCTAFAPGRASGAPNDPSLPKGPLPAVMTPQCKHVSGEVAVPEPAH